MPEATKRPEERRKRLIAIVDNDSAHLYYTSIVLQRLDYNIHTMRSAEEVMESLEVARPDLVLTEITLAGTDGVELLRRIRQDPKMRSLPVIVLTSSKDPAIKEACRREGCTDYLQKPVEPDVLYAAIQKATEETPRQYIRLATCLNVMVGEGREAEQTVIQDYVTALSEQGMFVNTDKPKPVGLTLPITIFLERNRIKVEGMVLYSFDRGKGPLRTAGMGIKFFRIGPEDRELIRQFIRRQITKGLTMGQLGGTVL
jgi:two-component system cell cycle response regulator DivK